MQAKYSHSQNILLRIFRYFWIYCEFRNEYQVQLSSQFPNFSSTPESNRNSRWPNTNSSFPNSIYLFKNLTDDTRICVWPSRISVGFWSGGEVGKLWRQLDLIFIPKFTVYPKIPKNSEQNVLRMAVFGLHIRLPQYFNQNLSLTNLLKIDIFLFRSR